MPGRLPAADPPSAPVPATSAWPVVAGTALGFLLFGALALLLSKPPLHVAPLNLAAGLALGAVLAFGSAAMPGVLLGAAGLGLAGAAWPPLAAGLSIQTLLGLGCGAACQAWAGAVLLRRFAAQPLRLDSPRAILLGGLVAGFLAPVIGASTATFVRWLEGTWSAGQLASVWGLSWLADATGVILLAPVVLCLFGQPAAEWRPRRHSVAVPLLLGLGLLAAGFWSFDRLQVQHSLALFEHDATRLAHAVETRLQAPVLALRALRGAVAAHPKPNEVQLQQATGWWLAPPFRLQSLGVLQWLPGSPAADAHADAPRHGGAEPAMAGQLVVQQVQPMPDNHALLGLDVLSLPSVRAAALAARASGEPAAGAGLLQGRHGADHNVATLVLAVYEGQPLDPESRRRQFKGGVFVNFSLQQAMADLREPDLKHLDWCLLDRTAAAGRERLLAGPEGCEELALKGRGPMHRVRSLMLADRALELHIACAADCLPGGWAGSRWVMPVVGLLSSALLAALLLNLTAQARSTEQAVQERTAELRLEMSERAQAQDALQASENRLRTILENLPLGIAFMNEERELQECNPHLCNMLGRSSELLRGRSLLTCFDSAEEQRIADLCSRLLSHRESVDSVESVKLRAANGRLTDVRVVLSGQWNGDGRVIQMVAALQDMTAHHQLQQAVLDLERADSANRAKSEFVSRMSRELRTPLNAMVGFAQLLVLNVQPKLAAHQLDWAQQIQRAGSQLLAMINDTLDLTRIELGAARLNLEAVWLPPLLAACRDGIQEAAALRGVKLQLQLAPDVPAVLADSTRLRQIVTNLLSNAVKYNREGGSVDLRVRVEPSRTVVIAVTDTGLGMTAEQVASLFQPYNRVDREGSAIEGSGISLAISRLLAELMGGTLDVQSAPGEGSTFTLSLPATRGPGATNRPPPQPDEAMYQHRLVHYVEDNSTNVEIMKDVLAQRGLVTLQTSTLGLDGLSAIRHSRPDLILLDMQLPDISGLELLRHIKQHDQIASIPVIVVSADASPQNMERALTLGAKHYVTKPLDIAAFLDMVDRALDRSPSLH